ncbi:hypothetical protein [Isorropodon fossajaponicum symbiont]|uniref:hypothetical protein n=1 Tax=Isorropodon fossajaponicum symbiont TaxID=883811 RepID=UPI001CED5473|nr:hypothetical protein [Isorropodon fossajaponicum symbiont]
MTKVTVDSTVQEKNITFPTDSKLFNKARINLVKVAKAHNINLRQNYNRKCKTYALMAGRYAHAKQFKRMRAMNKKLKSRLGRIVRDIERQLPVDNPLLQQAFNLGLAQAKQLINQQQNSKGKLYSLHAPEAECISKGKAHKKYEFGIKASIAVTNKGEMGDMQNVILCASGHNLRKILNKLVDSSRDFLSQFTEPGFGLWTGLKDQT